VALVSHADEIILKIVSEKNNMKTENEGAVG